MCETSQYANLPTVSHSSTVVGRKPHSNMRYEKMRRKTVRWQKIVLKICRFQKCKTHNLFYKCFLNKELNLTNLLSHERNNKCKRNRMGIPHCVQ